MFKSLKNDTNWQVITIDHLSDLKEISRLPVVYLQPSICLQVLIISSLHILEKKNLQYGTKIYGKSPINKFILYTTKSNKYNRKRLDY